MTPQAMPTYTMATTKPEAPIIATLIQKYGAPKVSWPIVLINNNNTIAYLYEINSKNTVNMHNTTRPTSKYNIPAHLIDYTTSPRIINPYAQYLSEFISENYLCSYDYIPNSPYSTVDLDYVWTADGVNFKGFELTTFWKEFYNKREAARLVSMMNRRHSWQGPNGAHALHRIVYAAEDLNIDYYMVCVNTVSQQVGSGIKTDGNVYYFHLTHDQITRLSNGHEPSNADFCKFNDFLNWL